jgi:hypothetical protein
MTYVDPTFQARRTSILGGTGTVAPTPQGGSLMDSSFQSRRTQVLSQPQPTATSAPTTQPVIPVTKPAGNIFEQIGKFISDKLNPYVVGGTQAGIERIKKTPITEYFMPTAKQAEPLRQRVSDTLTMAVNTVKGAGKLTAPYLVYRASLGNPVTPKEHGTTLLSTGLDALGFAWRTRPESAVVDVGFTTFKALRQYVQKKIEKKDIIPVAISGVTESPSVGGALTDNIQMAQAIDVVFLASMFARPFVNKKLNQLNLKAEEINSLKSTLGVKPEATMKEVQEAFKAKMKQYPDTFTANPNPANMAIRKELTDAYNALKSVNAFDLKYAQAYEFIQSKIGNAIKPVPKKPAVPKQIAEKAGETPLLSPTEKGGQLVASKEGIQPVAGEGGGVPTEINAIVKREAELGSQLDITEGKVREKVIEELNTIRPVRLAFEKKNAETVLTFPQKGNVNPLAEVQVVKYADDNYGVRYEVNTKTGGTSVPFEEGFKTRQEAVNYGLSRIEKFYADNKSALTTNIKKGIEKVKTETVKPTYTKGIDQEGIPVLTGEVPNIKKESLYGLQVGDRITKIGKPGMNGKETTSHRVDKYSTPIVYEGTVEGVGLPGKQLSFRYEQNGKVHHILYTVGNKDYIYAIEPNKLQSRQYSTVFEKVLATKPQVVTPAEVKTKPSPVTTKPPVKPVIKKIALGKAKPVKKVISTKETQSIQTVIADKLNHIRETSQTPEAMIQELTKLHTDILSKAKSDKVVLSSLRTALNKEMMGMAGNTGNYKSDYAQLQYLIKNEPETGQVLSKLEDLIIGLDEKLLAGGSGEMGFNPKNLQDPESPQARVETQRLIRKSEIAKALSEKLGVPIRRGKFNRQALGIFKQAPKVVRIKKGGLQTIFHEVGHFLDDQFKLSDEISVTEREALMVEYGYEYKNQPIKQRHEALAEFLRFKMTGQDAKAKSLAPIFYEEWNKRMEGLPEIKEVIDTATEDYTRWLTQPATAKILSHISIGTQNKGSLVDKVNATLHDLYTAALDDLHPLSEYSALAKKNLGPIEATKDPYILARNLRGWVGKAELFLTKGTFGKNFWSVENGKTKMNFTGKSYSEIMRPIEKAGKMDNFRVYIVAKRAIELVDRGIVTGINRTDAEEALKELGEKNPELEAISNERLAYKDALLAYAADPSSGVLGPDGLKKIKELNKYHVPFYRVMEETAGRGFMGRKKMAGNLGSPIKRIKGSEREIIDPLESDIKDTYAIINAVERNSVGVAMANLSTQNFELGRLFEKVDRPMKGTKVDVKEVLDKALKQTDMTVEDFPEELGDAVVTLFRPTQDRGPNMLNVNMGDKQMVFQVDPELFKSIQGLNTEDVGLIMRILSMPSKILRAGATLTPDFSLRNPIRDQFSALVFSKSGYIPGLDLVRGIFEAFKKGDVYELWKAGGGEHAMLVSMDRKNLQKNLAEVLHENKAKALQYVKNPLELLQAISEFGEQATRLGEMRRALRKGKNPVQAAFDSREVTLDFARTGAKTKAVNSLIAFWNANVQGSDKLVRAFKEKPFHTLFKVLMGITLPSILLYMANRKDPRWKEIPGWQKDLFWIIFTKNHIWRVPKPFEVGILFGSVPERILEYIDNKDPSIFNQLQADIANGATPGFIPTTLLPIIENISNYSFFLDRPIVSRGKENLPPEAQHGTYTTEIAKVIGKALQYSPAKIENLITGYTGGLGRYALQAIDKVLVGTGAVKIPPKPADSLSDLPVIKAFMIREPSGSSSESVNRLYNLYGEVGQKVTYIRGLVKDGKTQEAITYTKAHPEVVNYSTLNGAIQTFNDINQAKDVIMASEYLSPDEKRQKIKKLDEVQTTIAQKVLLMVQKK